MREDKRERMEEVLQHWNPTNLSGQLLLLIMYAIFMHATFPMLAAWSGACSCRQSFLGCVLSTYWPAQFVSGTATDSKAHDR